MSKKTCKEDGCERPATYKQSRCAPHRNERRRSKGIEPKNDKFKVLLIDIETKPPIVYSWNLWNANIGIDQIIEPGGMICFAAKWLGSDEVEFYSEWEHGYDTMMLQIWRLLDECDAVVHYYGSRFDVPHIQTEFLRSGLTPTRPFKQVDLKTTVSKNFKLDSNKLQFLSQVLGLEGKEEHEGFKLWDKVLNFSGKYDLDVERDAKARMESYNIRDVTLLEECYEILLPWIPNHPHRHLYVEGMTGCPTCAAEGSLVRDGYAYTKCSRFPQYRCSVCGYYFRSSRRDMGVTIQESVRL